MHETGLITRSVMATLMERIAGLQHLSPQTDLRLAPRVIQIESVQIIHSRLTPGATCCCLYEAKTHTIFRESSASAVRVQLSPDACWKETLLRRNPLRLSKRIRKIADAETRVLQASLRGVGRLTC